LEERISQIRGQAEVIAQKRREIQDSADFLRRIAQEAQNQPLVLEMLHELTQVLPRNVWLDSFVFARDQVRIQGQADSATSVIEALENSPLFRAVSFESPVTKSGKRDVFQVSAELES
jgi:Tfp pilus assembly protein PilN